MYKTQLFAFLWAIFNTSIQYLAHTFSSCWIDFSSWVIVQGCSEIPSIDNSFSLEVAETNNEIDPVEHCIIIV